jgi:tetratricopeptide (TPR) repeat protein/SAM-dependent methyltransferase
MNRKDRRAAGKQGRGSSGSAPPGSSPLFAQAVRAHQAGQLFEAEELYRQILGADPRHVGSLHHLGIIALQRGQPQAAIEPIGQALALNDRIPECHYNIAFAFQSLGRLDDAVSHYRQAIRLKPDYVDALTNLGNVLMQIGRNADAVEFYERVIALKPAPETHYNLANALAQSGRPDDAATHYRRALALKPDFVGAHNNLANVLMAQGHAQEAQGHFERALALDPKLPAPCVNLGNILLADGKLEEARAQFERALGLDANFPDAHANLGNVFLAQGRLDEAAQCYRRALALRADLPEPNNNLGLVLLAQGDVPEAIRHFELALARRGDFIEAHDNLARAFMAVGRGEQALAVIGRALAVRETPESKALFVQCMRGLSAVSAGGDVRALMVRALAEPWGRANDLALAAVRVLKQQGAIAGCVARTKEAWPRRLAAGELFGSAGLAAVVDDRLLACLLGSAPVADIEFERFLTNARFALLQIAAATDVSAQVDERPLAFGCSLARQCFLNEHVFADTEEERDLARGLRDKAITALASGAAIPELWLAAVASYLPLRSIPGVDRLLDRHWSDAFSAVLTQQVCEPLVEQELRAAIPALTPIEDDVSRMVRHQYEENPYPRWTKADPPKKPLPFDRYLRNQFPAAVFQPLGKPDLDILIAGCGTGQHAIETTRRFPAARVLAIDLSATSLAYAMRKTREAGLHNIEYGQADILMLGSIGKSFDLIEASGVLHHLAEPFAGWRILLSLLRPGGFMAVALYSEIARADIVKARAFIAERGYGSGADDIRRCRQDIVAQDGGERFKTVYSSGDFFTSSACRDLLFHVQEHRLTLAQIAEFLAANGLAFIGFELDGYVKRQYRARFPADRTMTDFASWDAFERDNPGTFSGMYQFWVQKPR